MYDLTDSWLEMPNSDDFRAKHLKMSKHITTYISELLAKNSVIVPHTYKHPSVGVVEGVDKRPRLKVSATVSETIKDINLTRAYYTVCWIETIREVWAQYASIRQDVMQTPNEVMLLSRESHLHWYFVLFQATKDHLAKPNLDTLFEELELLKAIKEAGPERSTPAVTAFYEKYAPAVSKEKMHQRLMGELRLFRTDYTLKRAHRWLSSDHDPIDPIDLVQLSYLLRTLHRYPNTYGGSTYMVRTIVENLNKFFNKTIDLGECLKKSMFLDPDTPASDLIDTTKFPCDLNAPEWKQYVEHL